MKKVKLLTEVYLPPSKYTKGDIIRIHNTHNKYFMYVCISKVIYSGTTIHCEQCGQTYTTIKEYRYEGIIQPESFYDSTIPTPLRPGKAVLFQKEDIENQALILHYPSEKIVDADNALNIKQREKDWRSYLSQYQQEKK